MPSWPGGPCPNCGDDMPARIIHCRNCRHLLNDDLEVDTVVEPAFQPVPEIVETPVIAPRGVHENCPACGRELKINKRFTGEVVRCKFCHVAFTVHADLTPQTGRAAYYCRCPHCEQSLRIATKYLGQQIACKFCKGQFRIELDQKRGQVSL